MKWKQSLKRRQQQVVEKRREEIKKLLQNLSLNGKKEFKREHILHLRKTFCCRRFLFFYEKGKCAKTCHNKKILFLILMSKLNAFFLK